MYMYSISVIHIHTRYPVVSSYAYRVRVHVTVTVTVHVTHDIQYIHVAEIKQKVCIDLTTCMHKQKYRSRAIRKPINRQPTRSKIKHQTIAAGCRLSAVGCRLHEHGSQSRDAQASYYLLTCCPPKRLDSTRRALAVFFICTVCRKTRKIWHLLPVACRNRCTSLPPPRQLLRLCHR